MGDIKTKKIDLGLGHARTARHMCTHAGQLEAVLLLQLAERERERGRERDPTNNALLINFLSISDAEILLLSTD